MKYKIYLDSCCYNRPYDDLTFSEIADEANSKLHIQSLIKFNALELVTSYILVAEIGKNRNEYNRTHILTYIYENTTWYIDFDKKKQLDAIAAEVMNKGIKSMDAAHIACAILAGCDYFISTDKRLLKYKASKIKLVNPLVFAKLWEDEHNG